MAGHDKLSSNDSTPATQPSVPKQRKKRRWDQPDESLISSSLIPSGLPSMTTVGCPSISLLGAMPTSFDLPSSLLKGNCATTQAPLLPLQAAVMVHKLNQPKLQEELVIAKEIVINDADPGTRYKLTKRQTQEEIQKCTGAVVITRGKFRPPNAAPDGEKPLYLHISSGAHIKETAERILVVDRAAAMVEDMLKQASQPLSTCVFVGFDADPSLNIVARIRGPNDQYINHIINETGATVVIRGHGSGYLGYPGEEGEQRLHLFLSSNNHKSLEDARLLAENLLDTISRECGRTRVSSCKLYGAVPPPQQLLVGVQSLGSDTNFNLSSAGTLACSVPTLAPGLSVSPAAVPAVTAALPVVQQLSTPCTSYSGYAGIYPLATPLQQVAQALSQSFTATSTVAPSTLAAGMVPKSSLNTEKRRPQKRKFQEAAATLTGVAISEQVSDLQEPLDCSSSEKKVAATLPRTSLKNLPPPASHHASVLPPSSRSIPAPPPPPPKFPSSTPSLVSKSLLPPPPPPPRPLNSTLSVSADEVSKKDHITHKPNLTSVPDTLVKLMEYGEDDDDDDEDDETEHEPLINPNRIAATKPFWAA